MSVASDTDRGRIEPTGNAEKWLEPRSLAVALDRTDNGVAVTDKEARILWVNAGYERLSGYTLAELERHCLSEILQGPHTDKTKTARLRAAIQAGRPVVTEVLNYHREGHPYWVEVDVQPVPAPDEATPEYFVAILRDITERKYGEALSAARAATLERLAAGASLSAILTALVEGLERVAVEMAVSILRLDDQGQTLHPVSGPGLPPAYTAALDGLTIGDGVGSCGTAAFKNERIISRDILNDPLWAPYQTLAELSGMRACWSEPIRGLEGQVLGTFALYYPMPRLPSMAEADFIQEAAQIAGTAIERKLFESRLSEREQKISALVENAAEGIYRCDMAGRFTEVNPIMARIHGCTDPEEFLEHFAEGRHTYYADDRAWPEIAAKARTQGRIIGVECRVYRCDGTPFWVSESLRAVTDERGCVVGYEGFAHDITERKQAREELESFKRILDNAVDQIFMFDAETLHFAYLNCGALESLGYTLEEMRRMTPPDIKPEFPEPQFREAIAPLLSGAESVLHFETVHRRKDGTDIPVEIILQLMPTGSGQQYFVAIGRDITRRREREAALAEARDKAEEASRAKSRFLAQMSHELRTPLNAVIGFADVIEGQRLGDDPALYAAYGQNVRESGETLLTMIQDVLDMAELDQGTYALDEQAIAPSQLIETCLRRVDAAYRSHGVSLNAEIPTDLPALRADPHAVRQILMHLLMNAAAYTEPEGTVAVMAAVAGDESLSISVADSGPGIVSEERERVLAPFERGGPVTENLAQAHLGAGLGLAVSREFMALHGGALVLESTPGEGTCVTMTFPAERVLPEHQEPTLL